MDDEKSIKFNLNDGTEVIRFCMNGDIYVQGRLVENDKQVVEGIRLFLSKAMPDKIEKEAE